MKLSITRIYKTNKNKEGQELMSKFGKNYTKIGVKALEFGDKWLSGLLFSSHDPRHNWKEGDVVEWDTDQSGQYLNLANWVKPDENKEEVKKLVERVITIESRLNALEATIRALNEERGRYREEAAELTANFANKGRFNSQEDYDKEFPPGPNSAILEDLPF